MADLSPSSPPHDRGHDSPQSVAGDAAILHQRGFEVQPFFSANRRIGWNWKTSAPFKCIWSRPESHGRR